MQTHSDKKLEPTGRLFSWLGLKKAADANDGPQHGDDHPGSDAKRRNLSRDARRALGQTIVDFLVEQDLDMSPENLAIAHAAFSGSHPPLAREINARLQTREPISQTWLNHIHSTSAPASDAHDIDNMMARLEHQVDNFQIQAKQARSITVQYGSALEQHVDDLEDHDKTGDLVSDLARLARTMLDRTKRAEQDMRRSEDEVRELRKNLVRARRDAEIDHLTGLPNRRAFEALLTQQRQEAREKCDALSVAICDIDEFKRINDVHGHDAGDRVIKVVAETLARISNDRCHVARHGGEEFVMLFRGHTPSQAAELLDNARSDMAQRILINRKTDTPFGQVTFSGGVADIFGYANERDALRAADEALYRAKEHGRNRIEVA
jgi:diguanylate cyclase